MIHRYARGVDRNDPALVQSAFWPGSRIVVGSRSQTIEEFLAVQLPLHAEGLHSYAHLVSNPSIDIDGDLAHVETYVTGLFTHHAEGTALFRGATISSGRYLHRMERRIHEWRIAYRVFVPQFSARIAEVLDPFEGMPEALVAVRSGRDDLSYRRPLTPGSTPRNDSG